MPEILKDLFNLFDQKCQKIDKEELILYLQDKIGYTSKTKDCLHCIFNRQKIDKGMCTLFRIRELCFNVNDTDLCNFWSEEEKENKK